MNAELAIDLPRQRSAARAGNWMALLLGRSHRAAFLFRQVIVLCARRLVALLCNGRSAAIKSDRRDPSGEIDGLLAFASLKARRCALIASMAIEMGEGRMFVVLRLISLILVVSALMLLGADAVSSLENGGKIIVRSLDQVWALFDKSGRRSTAANITWSGPRTCQTVFGLLAWPQPAFRESFSRSSSGDVCRTSLRSSQLASGLQSRVMTIAVPAVPIGSRRTRRGRTQTTSAISPGTQRTSFAPLSLTKRLATNRWSDRRLM